jgi:hypothetical protein
VHHGLASVEDGAHAVFWERQTSAERLPTWLLEKHICVVQLVQQPQRRRWCFDGRVEGWSREALSDRVADGRRPYWAEALKGRKGLGLHDSYAVGVRGWVSQEGITGGEVGSGASFSGRAFEPWLRTVWKGRYNGRGWAE